MDKDKQHDVVFTKRRALMGLIAYIVIALIIACFFLR